MRKGLWVKEHCRVTRVGREASLFLSCLAKLGWCAVL